MDIEKWCRICSNDVKCGVFLFGEESKKALLLAKIQKYLAVSISLEDKLPKMICQECIHKIDGFYSFAMMALKNQEKMTRCILSTPVSPEPTKTDNVSLLHCYLTKSIKVDQPEKECSNDPEITEMEVRVDPMSILQCCLDESGSDTETDPANEQDDVEDDESECTDGVDETQENASSEGENSENTCIIYLCSICKRSFATNFELQDHMYIHRTSYTKKILSSSFNKFQENFRANFVATSVIQKVESRPSIITAVIDNTEELSEVNCILCAKVISKDEEKDHIESHKEDQGWLKCPICTKDIYSEGALKVHLETHRPKGQYGCDICGRVFKTQCNLFRHKEYHQGIQFPCEVCGRVYPTNSTLRAHSITHSDLRPHKCPLCDKTFKRNQDLKFHINQHTGARPYQCPYCPKAFASSGNCFSHRKRMHPAEVERDRERAAKIMR